MMSSMSLKRALQHVHWIGGAPDAGKTAVARLLAERHGLDRYQFDRYEMDHLARADPVVTPALWAAHPDRMTTEQRWLGYPPDEMARSTIASWSERWRLAYDDILAHFGTRPLIAAGPGFFPSALADVLADARKAVWLVPIQEFKRRSATLRGKPGNRSETSNPGLASANIIARDLILGEVTQEQCASLGLTCLLVDGTEGVDAVARRVGAQFQPWLD